VTMIDLEAGDRAIVRIFENDSDCVVGMGFWVSPGRLVTCAHVVNQALGLENNAEEMPEKEVRLDFPFLNSGRLRAKVTLWLPVDQAQINRDIAVLNMLDDLPQDIVPIPLAEPIGKALITKGYPEGYNDFPLGAEVTISEVGATANGWIQLENPEGRVSPGFSGGLVWEKSSGTAAGMIVSSAEKSVAFMIPAWGIAEILGVPVRNARSREDRDDTAKKTVLMLPASSASIIGTRWQQEVTTTKEVIEEANKNHNKYEFQERPYISSSKLFRNLDDIKPYILHVAGDVAG
jgi:hypothetical protein